MRHVLALHVLLSVVFSNPPTPSYALAQNMHVVGRDMLHLHASSCSHVYGHAHDELIFACQGGPCFWPLGWVVLRPLSGVKNYLLPPAHNIRTYIVHLGLVVLGASNMQWN